ncbi:MAG: hypothetical protein LBQ66_09100 [Planctomycetaceae bacterium]|jgi:hypothetical protein|nr:hypothetical protein [Planctomycetaceae bacterium]
MILYGTGNAKEISSGVLSVGGTGKNLKQVLYGVNGVAKLVFPSWEYPNPLWEITNPNGQVVCYVVGLRCPRAVLNSTAYFVFSCAGEDESSYFSGDEWDWYGLDEGLGLERDVWWDSQYPTRLDVDLIEGQPVYGETKDFFWLIRHKAGVFPAVDKLARVRVYFYDSSMIAKDIMRAVVQTNEMDMEKFVLWNIISGQSPYYVYAVWDLGGMVKARWDGVSPSIDLSYWNGGILEDAAYGIGGSITIPLV